MEVIQIKQADIWGYMLYTEWRNEQEMRAKTDTITDEEMERLCSSPTEWPWDGIG